MIKKFILSSNNIEKDSFIWNMAGSMIMAFQSVVLLMILTRTVGLVQSGIFTIAYANANLFLTIGRYGMRNFQVSDALNEYNFKEYLASRWISTFAMFVVSFVYVIYATVSNGYSYEKCIIIIWMCIFKLPDSLEDIFYGEYQKRGRLDIGSKAMTLRIGSTIFLYAVLLILLRDQLQSLIIATCYTYVVTFILLKGTYKPFQEKLLVDWNMVYILLKVCFPLFAGGFLSFYIGNAPKYAIDSSLSDELQACYGFIAMPVFVVGLLNSFIFNPMLYRISCMWHNGEIKRFVKHIIIQILCVMGITGVCVAGGYFLGIPLLSVLYNTNLSSFKSELLILLLGGGFLGISGLLNAVITIMRKQRWLLGGYLVVAVLAFVLSKRVVEVWEIRGASLLYMLLMLGICICFFAIFIFGLLEKTRSSD
jgi:O-antigen/teichoic acid export membrane protein